MDSLWFKKSMPRSFRTKEEQEFAAVEDEVNIGQKTYVETLNAFHIISLSEGFNLSPLFEKTRVEKEELRFATTKPASSVITKLEEVAKIRNFSVKKNDSSVRLQGQESGRKGKLGIAADIFAVTPSLLMVEVKKSGGDTLEYNQFCSKELRPALKVSVINAANVSAQVSNIPMLSETNFKVWKEAVEIVLDCIDLNLALRSDRPASTPKNHNEGKIEK
ncbi:CBL-interacting serine/threonine-protein kinase 6-like [Olea europaea var. sylvestris]|uniref:CBL-interacting serine/threonine-protein kinase 6-like n=1 Tax=Olea europaea var. sylvestris TaxID=158386 RepID=UPI000C1D0B97|nr:CBL-interacting serine/threonine-protein kinase 6-like [Olea europaea var. sylvestris]